MCSLRGKRAPASIEEPWRDAVALYFWLHGKITPYVVDSAGVGAGRVKEVAENKLNARQNTFIAEYLVDMNATQAAIRAGYSEKTAYSIGEENLRKPEIANAIQEQLRYREQRTLVTADYVITSLKAVAERCMVAEPIFDTHGEPTGEYRFDSSGANRALELLGKNLKMFTDRQEVTGKDGADLNIIVRVSDG